MMLTALCAVTTLVMPELFTTGTGTAKSTEIPAWFSALGHVALVVGMFAVGLGAAFTHTRTAELLRVVAPGVALGTMLLYLGMTAPLVALVAVVAMLCLALMRRM